MTTMIECTLQRLTTSDEGTFGVFSAPALGFSCVSLEKPDRQNTPMISRIPAGNYLAEWGWTDRFKRDIYRLQDVPGRRGILIHPANFAGDEKCGFESELSGCIALGMRQNSMLNCRGQWQSAIINSRDTVEIFEALADQRWLVIAITDELGAPYPDWNA